MKMRVPQLDFSESLSEAFSIIPSTASYASASERTALKSHEEFRQSLSARLFITSKNRLATFPAN